MKHLFFFLLMSSFITGFAFAEVGEKDSDCVLTAESNTRLNPKDLTGTQKPSISGTKGATAQ
jgi:hypothetical protein